MKKQFLRVTTFIAAGIAQTVLGQTTGTFPTFPRVWTINRPPTMSLAATDPNFVLIMTDKVLYGRPAGPYPPGYTPSPRDPRTAAWQIATDYTMTQQGQPLSIQLGYVTTRDLWLFSGPDHFTVEDGACRLYQHPDDTIRPVNLPENVRLKVVRTPWMNKGITETAEWSQAFCQELATQVAVSRGDIPRPFQFLFDEEVPVIGKELAMEDLVNYWTAIKTDARWKSSTIFVPGHQTNLNDSWIAAGSPELRVVTGTPDWRYWRGSAENQRWWTWWSQVCMTAYAGAMDQAFYQYVRASFPPSGANGPTPLCSDYDQSLVLDGRINPELPANGPTNSYLSFESLGGFGPGGQRFVFKQPGDLSNIAQAPHLYGDFSLMHLQYFNGTTFGNAAWASSDDNQVTVPPPERWGSMQNRMIRHRLSACLKSTEGRARPIIPWVTLPNQFTSIGCDNGSGVQQYRGQRFGMGMPVRQSNAMLTRTLAHCKSHGVRDMILWNDSDTTVDGVLTNYGLHCQWRLNWDLFREAAANAYGYTAWSVYNDANTTVTLPGPTSYSANVPACDLVSFSDGDYADAWRGKVRVTGNRAGVGTWFVTRFRKQTDANTTSLEFNIELRPEAACRLWIYVRGSGQSTWTQLADSGLKSAGPTSMGTFPYNLAYNRTARLRAAIPYDPNFFPAGGDFHVAIYMVPNDSFRTMASMVDLVQVYGVSPTLRQAGDINGDYVYDSADRALFVSLLNDYLTGSPRARSLDKPILDMDRNGVIDMNDLAAYDALCAGGGGAVYVEDDLMSVFERP